MSTQCNWQNKPEALLASEPVLLLGRGDPQNDPPEDKKNDAPLIAPHATLSVKSLTEGAMMAALFILLGLIAAYMPFLNFIAPLVLPLPITVVTLRNGVGIGILTSFCGGVILALLITPLPALLIVIQYALLGLFMGYCFRVHKKPAFTLIVATMIAACGVVVSLLLASFVAGLPIAQIGKELQDSLVAMLQYMKDSGLTQSLPNGMTFDQYQQMMLETLKRILPGMFLVTGMALTVFNYLITVSVLRRLGINIARLPKFEEWRLPVLFVWLFSIGLVLFILGKQLDNTVLAQIGVNALFVFFPILFVCGLSLVFWLIKRWRAGSLMKILTVIILIYLSSVIVYLLVLLALFDPLLDIRQKYRNLLGRQNQNKI